MPLKPNKVRQISIDEEDSFVFEVKDTWTHSKRVSLKIDGDEAASYAVDLGVESEGSDEIEWFDDEVTYDSKADINDQWAQAERYLRLRITDPASADSDARLSVSTGH